VPEPPADQIFSAVRAEMAADPCNLVIMQYMQLGSSGLTVSRLALGAMTFGTYSFATFHADVGQADADTMSARSTRARPIPTAPG
jgi:methyl coenzyme M reductase alpha subunit